MATKKKVDDEASDPAEVVDTEAVDAPSDDTPAEVKDADGKDVPAGDDGIPVLSESTPVKEPVENKLVAAQAVLGVPATGEQNHATKMALRKFQSQTGLSPTGRLDGRTIEALHI